MNSRIHPSSRMQTEAPAARVAGMIAVLAAVVLAGSAVAMARAEGEPGRDVSQRDRSLPQPEDPSNRAMAGVGITEKPGAELPKDLVFTDSTGEEVTLGEFFDGETPVLFNLVYYKCPGLCTAMLNGTVSAINDLEWAPGDQYRVVSVSFNAEEGPELAREKRGQYVGQLDREPVDERGWAFLTGDERAIEELTEAVGFAFRWNEEMGMFAHGSALMAVTPDGRISNYFKGTHYDAQTVRLGLVEASDGEVGSAADRFWASICGYDPQYGKYVVRAQWIMSAGGVLMIATVGAMIGLFWRLGRKRQQEGTAEHA